MVVYWQSLPNLCLIFLFVQTAITESNTSPTNLSSLRLVQVIARHGDRAPILPYPKDPYKDVSVYSINGWGELSELGAKQVYHLGIYLRNRYDGFLPRKYRKRDFLMVSSDVDRAIMSAEANLAGLYALSPFARSHDIFKDWQPVPIHTIPAEEDNILNAKASCPRHYSLYKEFLASNEYTTLLHENKDLINYVVENSGYIAILEDFSEIFLVQDTLKCQFLHNLPLPLWVNSTVYKKLEYFKALSFTWNVKTEEMKRLKMGPLFKRLITEMQAKVDAANLIVNDATNERFPYRDPSSDRKMYVYSGHDSTITSVLETLNLFQVHLPAYASALIFELHQVAGTGNFYVEIFYKNDSSNDPYKLDTSNFCGGATSECSFENYSSFLHKYIPSSWNDECRDVQSEVQTKLTYIQAKEGNFGFPAASGLSGLVLAGIAGASFATSTVILTLFIRHGVATNQFTLNSLYRNLS